MPTGPQALAMGSLPDCMLLHMGWQLWCSKEGHTCSASILTPQQKAADTTAATASGCMQNLLLTAVSSLRSYVHAYAQCAGLQGGTHLHVRHAQQQQRPREPVLVQAVAQQRQRVQCRCPVVWAGRLALQRSQHPGLCNPADQKGQTRLTRYIANYAADKAYKPLRLLLATADDVHCCGDANACQLLLRQLLAQHSRTVQKPGP